MDWRTSWTELWRETFLGVAPGHDGTWFVQGSEALLPSLEQLPLAEAVREVAPGVASMAAHVQHAAYYIELSTRSLSGELGNGDWAASWMVAAFEEAEWRELRERLRQRFEELNALVQDLEPSQEQFTYLLSNLCHAAFHLGAIRQLMKFN